MKKIQVFLTFLMLIGAFVPVIEAGAIQYEPGQRLPNNRLAPLAYSSHVSIPEINPWSDQLGISLEYERDIAYSSNDYYPIQAYVYYPKDEIDNENYDTEAERDQTVFMYNHYWWDAWGDKVADLQSETWLHEQELTVNLTKSLDNNVSNILYYAAIFEDRGENHYSNANATGKIDYTECKEAILSGKVDSVVCEANLVGKQNVRYLPKTMAISELESPEYVSAWEKVKKAREDIQNQKLGNYVEQIDELKRQIEELQVQLDGDVSEIDVVKEALADLKVILAVMDGADDLVASVEQLEIEIKALGDKYDTSSLQALILEKIALQKQLDDLLTAYDDLGEQLDEVNEELLDTQSKLLEAEESRELAEQEANNVKNENDELRERNNSLESEVANLMAELEVAKGALSSCSGNKDEVNGSFGVSGSNGNISNTDNFHNSYTDNNVVIDDADNVSLDNDNSVNNAIVEAELGSSKVLIAGTITEVAQSESNDISGAIEAGMLLSDDERNLKGKGVEDNENFSSEVEVPSLGEVKREFWWLPLILAFITTTGIFGYLIKRGIIPFGRDQR